MSHFLFAVDIPPLENGAVSVPPSNVGTQWLQFAREMRSIQLPASSSKQLCRNVWLLDAKNALPALVALSGLAERCGLQTTSLLLSGDIVELAPGIRTPKE